MSTLRQTLLVFRLEARLAARNFIGRLSRERTGWRAALPMVLFVVFTTPALVMFCGFGAAFTLGMNEVGQPDAALALVFVAATVLALVFGFLYVMSAFYFATDLRILLPLPLRPAAIVTGKFLRVVTSEYLLLVVFLLPAMVVYGWLLGGLLYWPFALVVFLLLPVLPLALDAVVVMLLMRATAPSTALGKSGVSALRMRIRLRPSRDLLRIVAVLLAVGLVIGIQFALTHTLDRAATGTAMPTSASMLFVHSLNLAPHLTERLTRFVPPVHWAVLGLAAPTMSARVGWFFAFVATSLGALLVVLGLAARWWLPSVELDQGTGQRTRARTKVATAGAPQRSPFRALVWREWATVVRTPMFLLNSLMPIVLMIAWLVLLVPTMRGLMVAQWRQAIADPGIVSSLVPIIGAVATGLFASMSTLGSTAISREGKRFWIARALPVDPALHVLAKLAICGIHALVGLAFVLGAMTFLGASPLKLSGIVLLAIPTVALVDAAVMAMDLWRPYLAWTDPQQALNGNLNAILGFAIATGVLAAIFSAGALVAFLAPALVVPVLLPILAGLAFVAVRALLALARTRYRDAPM